MSLLDSIITKRGRCKNRVQIIEKMNNFKEQGLFCDVVIRCDDNKTFDAHRLVLAAASPYFRAMFQSSMLECTQNTIHLKGVDSNSLRALINYAYTAVINFDIDAISSLITAANMLCFEDIEKACLDTLRENISISNCIGIYTLAESLNYAELSRASEVYMTKHFRWIAKHCSFANMTPDQLETVIRNDKLSVTSETEVYRAVIAWVHFEPEARLKFLAGLLRHVRLTLMSRKFLVDIVMREPLVMDDYECRTLVLATLDHFLLPERRQTTCKASCHSRRNGEKTLFVIGGQVEKRVLNVVETFDFNQEKWTSVAPLMTARRNVAAVVLEGVLYVVGGTGHNNSDLASVEKFSVETGNWQQVASLSKCKGALRATVIDGWIYVAGGSDGKKVLKSAERYDPLTDQWTAVSNMRLQRSQFGMTSLAGNIYAIGGYNGISEVEHCEYLNPVSLKWHDITCMNKSRRNHTVVAHNDRIYAIGGSNCRTGSLNSIEKYNPDLNMWLVVRSCSSIRPGLVACLFQSTGDESHDLLLVGGYDVNEKEHNEIRALNLRSPDYFITKFTEMNGKKAFAAAVIL